MGERATCCARLHPRQACRTEGGAYDSVFRQLSVGTIYFLRAGVPFGKQSWGGSAWLSCSLVRPLSVSRCDGPPPVDDNIFPFFKADGSEGLAVAAAWLCHLLSVSCSPGLLFSHPVSAAGVSTHSSATYSTFLPWEVVWEEDTTDLFCSV